MKIHLPAFLRKKTRSTSSLRAMPGSGPPSGSVLSSLSSASPGSRIPSSSEGSWSSSLIQAQKVSTKILTDVALQEATATVRSQYVMRSSLRDPELELREAFRRFDANGDGKISVSELGAVMRSLGDNPSEEELLLMVKEVDRDGDGFIDLEEFVILNSSPSPSLESEELRDAFQVFDVDADGKISVHELHRVLVRLGESCTIEECSRMIRGVDRDGDGFVDFQEFCTMMSSQ